MNTFLGNIGILGLGIIPVVIIALILLAIAARIVSKIATKTYFEEKEKHYDDDGREKKETGRKDSQEG